MLSKFGYGVVPRIIGLLHMDAVAVGHSVRLSRVSSQGKICFTNTRYLRGQQRKYTRTMLLEM